MEADWERTVPPVELDVEGARRLLAPVGIVPLDVAPLSGGKANTSLRVDTEDGSRLLRILQRDPRKQANEALLAQRLQGLVPTPAVLAQGVGFLVYEWREGVTLEKALSGGRDLPYERIAVELAEVRLALDTMSYPAAGLFNDGLVITAPWSGAVASFFGYARMLIEASIHDRELAVRVEETMERAEPRLAAIQGPPVLVHGDFKVSNLLVNEAGLTAVLDWEFAHVGTRLADVGQLLRFPESLPPAFVPAFLDRLGLDEDDAILGRTLDLANLVDLYVAAPDGSLRKRTLRDRILRVCDEFGARFGAA